ncbi:MAG: hypothetical protein Q8S49_12310, partial [Pseudomonas sp.]|nr:hypothetical protein [Pseudomonas sp.]
CPPPKSALQPLNKWRKERPFFAENTVQTLLLPGFSQIDFRIYPTIVVRALRGGLSDDFKHN